MAGRVVVLHWSGEGCEVLGLGAELVRVGWYDYPSAAEALNAVSVVVRGLRSLGYVGADNCVCKGVGESFREQEFFVVESESGKEVR